ncbi:hypothetical protein TO73_1559 [Thermus aquaticus Y51MC23]|uniref:Uncharacterized protein n=1 Tax=Thermus aquaticus (strain ATCC BAA-2747 / Y51MC23) TaxID=498848 RepID=A0ABM5VMR5_THEA5|nr:hypothetical protein TO73_1559 [Thermus aquaticus Y51MC23]
MNRARDWDIPTRYPDAFPEGPFAEHYGPLQSQEVQTAEK